MQGGWESSGVQCLQNQSERHVERLIFPFLISQSPAAWWLGGQGMRKWDSSGQKAGDVGLEWQVGMLYEVLGLTLSQASLAGWKRPGS